MPSHELAPPSVTTVDVYSPSHTPVLTVRPEMFAVPLGQCSGVHTVLPDRCLA